MNVPGIPQSATGQTSLWTGINASQILGFHLTGFPGPILRNIIKEHSIIKKIVMNHLKATLVNAYSHEFLKKLQKIPRFASASTLVQRASGQDLFTIDAILEKKAIYMDITHQIMHEYYPQTKELFPVMDPYERGRDLIEIAKNYDLILFEYFLSDKAGHSQSFEAAQFIITILEKFIKGIIENLRQEDTLIITSDHGNLEDLSIKTHTKNLVPLVVSGKLKKDFQKIRYLYEIPIRIYEIFDIPFSKREYTKEEFIKTTDTDNGCIQLTSEMNLEISV